MPSYTHIYYALRFSLDVLCEVKLCGCKIQLIEIILFLLEEITQKKMRIPFNTHTHSGTSQSDQHLFEQLFAADLHLFVHFDERFRVNNEDIVVRHYFEALYYFFKSLSDAPDAAGMLLRQAFNPPQVNQSLMNFGFLRKRSLLEFSNKN